MELSALLLAFALDMAIGDPRILPHPVRGIGTAIKKTEEMLRKQIHQSERDAGNGDEDLKKQEKRAGILLVIIIGGLTYFLFSIVSSILLHPYTSAVGYYLSFILFVYLVSTTLATRELIRSVRSVSSALNSGRMEEARNTLGFIVGRDTGSLDSKGIVRAAIETLSENASDGIIAPLFFYAIGGLPLAMTYKAINTLDSMVGYKNREYRNFGWASARVDDILNYIPARLTGILIVAAVYMLNLFRYIVHEGAEKSRAFQGRAGRYIAGVFSRLRERTGKAEFEESIRAFEIMKRDGRKHPSPNSGIPEAAMAGALGVRLGGPSVYGGRVVQKPYIGEEVFRGNGEEEFGEGLYERASKKGILLTKIVSLLGLLCAVILLSIRSAL